MIRLNQTIKLSTKKVKFSKGKSAFVIVPIALMFALLVFASSEITNVINVAEKSVFSSIDSQNQVIELNKNQVTGGPGGTTTISFDGNSEDTGYTATDTSTIDGINNVDQANLVTTVPIKNISTSDAIGTSKFSITSLAGLEEKYASVYTNENFSYKEGDAIPIILNANDFKEIYEEWNGQDSIVVDLSKLRNAGPPAEGSSDPVASQNPSKTKALTYSKEDLIGKEITINFGGLDAIQDYTQTPSVSGITFAKKTAETIATETATRQTDISKYWDYSKISTPLTYKFVVVGIIEGSDKTKSYVPTAFADKVLQDYLKNAVDARNSTAIDSTLLNLELID